MSTTAGKCQAYGTKPRIFILSDISNEPDDAESLVRYLLYSNQFDTRGLAAVTSTWLKTTTHPEDMHKIVDAYDKVVANLNKHVHSSAQYQPADYFRNLICSGPRVYGKQALESDCPLSDGAASLLAALDESDEPLWVLLWGGANCLAQALKHTESRTAAERATLVSKLRVYAISDQDDTAVWIRVTFPAIFWIGSVHGFNMYGHAAWIGISGDVWYDMDPGGPDTELVCKEWLKEHIQIGPLGAAYPDYMFAMEGDTPTFLYLIQNGLGVPEKPNYGGWGGRYLPVDLGGTVNHWADAIDRAKGKNGSMFRSSQATIWRWREAFQLDFAARMQWTLSGDFAKMNHAPVIIVDGCSDLVPIELEAEAATSVELDASESYDPDGDDLTFTWTHYKEPTATQSAADLEVQALQIEKLNNVGSRVKVTLPRPEKCCLEMFTWKPLKKGQLFHLILEVSDSGTPQMRCYRRFLLQATNEKLLGGGAAPVASIAEAQEQMRKT